MVNTFTPHRLYDHDIEGSGLLLVGIPGAGKTFLLASGGKRSLIITTKNGMETLIDSPYLSRFKDDLPYIEVVDETVDDLVQAGGISRALSKIQGHFNNYVNAGLIDTFVIDSGSDTARFARYTGFGMNKAERNSTYEQIKENHWYLMDMSDIGDESALLGQFIDECTRVCKAREINFAMGAHERYFYSKPDMAQGIGQSAMERVNKITPGFAGQSFPFTVNQYFSMVWRIEPMKKSSSGHYYKIKTDGDNIFVGKNRWKSLFKDEILYNYDAKIMGDTTEKDVYLKDIFDRIKKKEAEFKTISAEEKKNLIEPLPATEVQKVVPPRSLI